MVAGAFQRWKSLNQKGIRVRQYIDPSRAASSVRQLRRAADAAQPANVDDLAEGG